MFSSSLRATAALAATLLFAVACSATTDSEEESEADLRANGCKPVNQLSCAVGETKSTDGCRQPSAPAAASLPRGRCVVECKPKTQLSCATGETKSTDGCRQPSAPGAASLPLFRCASLGCKPVSQLSCADDEGTTVEGCPASLEHCVKDGCKPVNKVTCSEGEVLHDEDCAQALDPVGDALRARCGPPLVLTR